MRTRSLRERIIHAVAFEVLAILTVSPLAAWLMDKPLFQMGILSVILSTVAMLWNMIYNTGFDRYWPPGQPRSTLLRVLHGLGFEGGFILFGLPLTAWLLKIGLLTAFMLEVAFFLFFLPFTVLYNWLYDYIRARLIHRIRCNSH